MSKENLSNLSLERSVLSSYLAYPELMFETESFQKDDDFIHPFHRSIFLVLKDTIINKQKIDYVLLAQKLCSMGLKSFEAVDTLSYCQSVIYNKFESAETAKSGAEELSKLTQLRSLVEQAERCQQYVYNNKDKKLDDIFIEVDRLNNEIIHNHGYEKSLSNNIFSTIRKTVEDRADNPPKNFLFGPFKTINDIYGTLLPPACLNLIGARSGVSKTALSMFYLLHIAEKYQLPILHLDFSEMTPDQLKFRTISAFTFGVVPYHALVRGTWRKNAEWTKLVRDVYPRVEKLRMFYFDIGAMSEKQQIGLMRKIYNKEVKGRIGDFDKEILLLNYDYLKPFDSSNHNNAEWKVMGKWIQDYKSLVNNELPNIRGWFSLQVNRGGITNNKMVSQVDDSENTFTMSDRIMQQSTSAFIIRQKLPEEILAESNKWGNLKMIPLKFREVLGDQWERHFNWIRTHDGKYKKNYVNLNMRSFFFEDKGDAQAVENFHANQIKLDDNHKQDDINI